MQNIFGRYGFLANPAFGEGNIFRNSGIEVMGDHHHIEGLIKRICSVWPRWSRRRWNDVWFAADLDDVGGVAAAGSFGVKGVNSSSLKGCDRILDKAAFIERVRV